MLDISFYKGKKVLITGIPVSRVHGCVNYW